MKKERAKGYEEETNKGVQSIQSVSEQNEEMEAANVGLGVPSSSHFE